MTIQTFEQAIEIARSRLHRSDHEAHEALNMIDDSVKFMSEVNANTQNINVALRAERDALQAKLDAVPVEAIRTYYRMSEASYDALEFWEDNQRPFENAEDAINAWITELKQVQP